MFKIYFIPDGKGEFIAAFHIVKYDSGGNIGFTGDMVQYGEYPIADYRFPVTDALKDIEDKFNSMKMPIEERVTILMSALCDYKRAFLGKNA